MMKREDQYLYLMDRNLFCHVVGVPYQGNATAVFILPDEGRMRQLEAGLNQETLRKWLKTLTKRYSSASTGASLTRHTPRETHVPKGHSGGKDSQPKSCLQAQRHQVKSQPPRPGPDTGSRAGRLLSWWCH